MVLHGTNGVPPDILAQCIERGITRINVNKLVLDTYYQYIEENTGKVPFTELVENGTKQIQNLVEEWMDHIGSSGKANR